MEFFLPATRWGAEIVRNGGVLREHVWRFDAASAGRYNRSGKMEDYLIEHCREWAPGVKRRSLLGRLVHVVFAEGFTRDHMLDAELAVVVGWMRLLVEETIR